MPPSATAETFVKSDDAVVSTATELAPSEISKTEPLIHRGFQLSYPQAVPNYQGFRLLPQGSQSQEASGLPTFVVGLFNVNTGAKMKTFPPAVLFFFSNIFF
jgi:hypothetical protein